MFSRLVATARRTAPSAIAVMNRRAPVVTANRLSVTARQAVASLPVAARSLATSAGSAGSGTVINATAVPAGAKFYPKIDVSV